MRRRVRRSRGELLFVLAPSPASGGAAAPLAVYCTHDPDVRPEAERFANAPIVEIDPARFGAPAEKKRLLARRQCEIGNLAR